MNPLNEALSLRGRWWVPGHDDHQVYGTLTWDANDGGTLHLHDEMRPVVWLDNVLADGSVQKYRADRGEFQRTYQLIFGRVGNRAYTLLDSFRISAREYGMDERFETIRVNRVLDGAWLDDPDEFNVDRVSIDMRHLTSWVGHSGLTVDWASVYTSDTNLFAVLTARNLPAFTINHDSLTFRLSHWLSGSGDHVHDLGVTQWWSLWLGTSQPEPVDTFLDKASDFQDLVSIAVGQTAQFEKVVLQHPDVPLRSLDGTPIGDARDDITYYARWSNRTAPREPVKRPDMYFTFDDLGGIDGVRRWLEVAVRYRTELGRVMATRYREAMVVEDRIMNVCAALDSFDQHRRSTGKWVKYAKRVGQCIDLVGQPFHDLIVIDRDEWTERVVRTRDDLAHHREQFRSVGAVGHLLLAEQLFWLFALCMLRSAEAPGPVYDSITRHPQVRWLSPDPPSRCGGVSVA